ncbi:MULTISPECIES: sigma-70 family RNA polymerase sigma factor [Cupriavidus]|jgi:RNA polymerase sigma-70 factor (ECF subfamily)|uniref:Sigma-70 family RNA polymerase sigma factor n=1 Tax=Cupriavidus pauculus TaxID=82633 RepID=A0A5P2GZ47_9BURK|nr:sigma-70 family RNA polymerase sigma factor [Cupriavidus pauculus]QET00826.1 sigma-70 family RNA polymerase sigma factor [Cupriavidus pauculus]
MSLWSHQTVQSASSASSTSSARTNRFDALVLPHADAAHNLARWLCGNAQDADALAHASLRHAEQAIGGFQGERPRTWLLAMVHATWRARQPAMPERDTLDLGTPSAGDPMLRLREEDLPLVQAALERLPVAAREAIVLRELEGLHYRDIAAVTDSSREAVQATLSRARRQLAATIVLLRSSTP